MPSDVVVLELLGHTNGLISPLDEVFQRNRMPPYPRVPPSYPNVAARSCCKVSQPDIPHALRACENIRGGGHHFGLAKFPLPGRKSYFSRYSSFLVSCPTPIPPFVRLPCGWRVIPHVLSTTPLEERLLCKSGSPFERPGSGPALPLGNPIHNVNTVFLGLIVFFFLGLNLFIGASCRIRNINAHLISSIHISSHIVLFTSFLSVLISLAYSRL